MSKPYSVLVVDDHPLIRYGVCHLIAANDDFRLFGEVATGMDALASVTHHEPDIVLMDINMKEMSGLETLTNLRKKNITSRIVILTFSKLKQDVKKFMTAGVDGYLLKDIEPEALLEQLKKAMQGHRVISNQITPYLYDLAINQHQDDWIDLLTPRELEILQKLAEGLSNRAISEALEISEGTVKVHVKNLLRKANAKSRTEMAVRFLNQ